MKRLLLMLTLAMVSCGCSIRKMAVNKVGSALASGGATFSSDEDPELVREAVPFSLKLMESLLAESPKHRELLLAASRGFTQYAYAFLQQKADEVEDTDLESAKALRLRAQHMYLRARDYGLRGLAVRHPGIEKEIADNPQYAVRAIRSRADVPLLYWTAASWGAAISLSKNNPEVVADQPQVEALMDRAFALDEAFDSGAIHGFMVNYECSRQGAPGDCASRSREHFDRAVKLSDGKLASPYVALAEKVSEAQQNKREFQELLKTALAIDPGAKPEWRLENLIMQRRARWLLSRVDQLFLP